MVRGTEIDPHKVLALRGDVGKNITPGRAMMDAMVIFDSCHSL